MHKCSTSKHHERKYVDDDSMWLQSHIRVQLKRIPWWWCTTRRRNDDAKPIWTKDLFSIWISILFFISRDDLIPCIAQWYYYYYLLFINLWWRMLIKHSTHATNWFNNNHLKWSFLVMTIFIYAFYYYYYYYYKCSYISRRNECNRKWRIDF